MEVPHSCPHSGCDVKFKAQKHKFVMHHNTMEPECKSERKHLINLLQKYKKLLTSIIKANNIDINDVNMEEGFTSIKLKYEKVEANLVDNDYFHCLLGSTYEEECPLDGENYMTDLEKL